MSPLKISSSRKQLHVATDYEKIFMPYIVKRYVVSQLNIQCKLTMFRIAGKSHITIEHSLNPKRRGGLSEGWLLDREAPAVAAAAATHL